MRSPEEIRRALELLRETMKESPHDAEQDYLISLASMIFCLEWAAEDGPGNDSFARMIADMEAVEAIPLQVN